jgi:hypothetical protein
MVRRLLLALLVVLTGCSDLNLEVWVYATLQEAMQAGAVERGGVPKGLPHGTTDIRVGHKLNSAAHWGTFTFPTGEADAVRGLIEPTEIHEGLDCHPPGRLEWWPRLLRTPIDFEAAKTTGLRFYRSRDGAVVYAIHWAGGKGYYWRED